MLINYIAGSISRFSLRQSVSERFIGRIHGAIVAATIAPTGCGDDHSVYTPHYVPLDKLYSSCM